ncbi:MAG: Holliday junction branch migration protein RuvA [Caldilineaceae bacterium]
MIRLVRGTIISVGKDYLVVEIGGGAAGGIGVKVHAPAPTLAQHAADSAILLHTYLQVREDALTLFGFETEDELEMFELLLGVNGVGPKVALSTLIMMTPDALRLALINEDRAWWRCRALAKRTAEKIVLELKDKVRQPLGMLPGLGSASNADSEVIEALIALGYSVVEAQRRRAGSAQRGGRRGGAAAPGAQSF